MASATSGGTTVERDILRRERIFGEIQRRGALVVLIAVVIVGALTLDQFFTGSNIENILLHASFVGLIAVVLAAINMVGGFVVTDRMLQMFTGRKKAITKSGDGA